MVSTSPSDERPFPRNRDPIYPDKLICFDPHSYSSGRWLRQDKSERAARYIKFDFNALCQKVLDISPGAETITNCKKLEGGFNRVFVFTLNNAKRVVARLPFALAGPAKLTTASEVATIKYLQSRTSIPIPAILDWSNNAINANNTIGSEYIIMEHATGVQLHQKWPEMAGDQRVKCIDTIYRKIKELVNLQFPAFGSLYFAKLHDFGGTYPLDKEFCIGPHCGTRYWDCSVEAAIPLLFYPDLYKRNIFVLEGDPATITGIIDWQATSIEPAFWYSDKIPDFTTPTETGKNIYAKAFEISSQFLTPILSGPRLMDESLFRPFRYSYRTWKDRAVALRHDIIETARSKDFTDHEKEYKLFEAAQILRHDLSNLLNTASDGWVPPEEWKATESAHKEIFTGMLQAVLTNQGLDKDKPVKDEETLRLI
ncbi:hypothetical protein ETB97_007792 [Aspergillus alliaceus]|uniref:Altered inheritance of mitochondria protein 9, mitochondrial n=1 Tax=Petromyces alliaceus TaxID=209559 RepID=A0A8H5ZVT8_PETAA|nr:hypothetical protein ETB97_007792 [Aspergillus burnettii]